MEKITALVQVHVTPSEKVAIERAAGEERRSVSSWARGKLVAAVDREEEAAQERARRRGEG